MRSAAGGDGAQRDYEGTYPPQALSVRNSRRVFGP
jgi:hypothetical protein